jgi:hypothetical protein
MSWTRWLRALKPQLTSLRSRSRPARSRPAVESLEERSLFALSILSTADPSFLSSGAPVTTANGQSEMAPVHSVSDDGKYTVYASSSTNIVKNESANSTPTLNIYLYNSSNQTNTLISSKNGDGKTQGDGDSFNAVISGDGSTVVFYSLASNLISGDTISSSTVQLYSYNVSKGTLSLVSHTTTSSTTGTNGTNPAIPPLGGSAATISTASESGNTVTITTSTAHSLTAGQPVAITGVGSGYDGTYTVVSTSGSKTFTYNTATTGLSSTTGGTETPLINTLGYSVGTASTLLGQDIMGLTLPSVSSDGTYIAYISDASNLGASDTGGNSGGGSGGNQPYTNVFLYDASADTNTLVSHLAGSTTTDLTTSASGFATTAAISSDGTTIAFTDPAKDLISSGSGLGVNDQLYVWSRTTNSTTGLSAGQIVLASHTYGTTSTALTTGTTIPSALQGGTIAQLEGFTGWTADTPPSVSKDGTFVAYYDAGDDLVSTSHDSNASVLNVFRYDVKNNSNALVSHEAGSSTVSGDNPQNQVAPPDLGPVEAVGPQISSDGRYIAYANNSSNLLSTTSPFTTGGSTYDGRDNVFLYDATTGDNTLVSHADGSATTPDYGGGTAPSISADGRYVSYVDVAVPVTPAASWSTSIKSATESGSEVTITTSSAHDLVKGDVVLIAGVGDTGYDGLYTIDADPSSSTTFTYKSSQTGLTSSSKGTVYLTGSGSVRLFDSQASSATTQPPVVGTVFDSGTTLDIIAGSLAPTVMSAKTPSGDSQPVIAWDGLATDVVSGATDKNSNFDVFESITPTMDITLTTPTGPPVSTATASGTTVGTLSTTPSGSYTYSLVNISGVTNSNSSFSLSSSGTLTTATTFSVTTATNYTVSVQSTSTTDSTVSVTKSFTITVYPQITSISFTPSTTLVLNTSSSGSSLGTLSTTDPNANQTFTYKVLTNTSLFQIGSDGSSITTATTNITAGAYTVSVQVTDKLGLTLTSNVSVTVYQLPSITSTGTTFTVGASSTSYTLSTTGYPSPSSFKIDSGTVPSGLKFDTSTGTFSGTANTGTGGQYTLKITATNTAGNSSSTTFVLTVNETPSVTSTGTTFTVGTSGTTYTLVTTGYPAPTSYAETGTLPSGMKFDTTTGTFSGTPSSGTGGTYSLSVTATNSVGTSASQSFLLTVNETPTVTSTGTTFTVGTSGTTYTLATTGYPSPTSYAETGSLPSGLSFSTSTGTFSGTPNAGTGGTYSLSVTAKNVAGTSASQAFTLTVNEAPSITTTAVTLTAGSSSNVALATNGYPKPTFSYTGTLPANVKFDTSTGTFTGTPASGSGGQYTVTVKATNSLGTSSSQTVTITVNEAPSITSTSATFTPGQNNNFTLVTTGYPAPTFTITGTLPSGIHFDTTTGKFTGQPDPGVTGSFTFTIKASNGIGSTFTQTFTLNIGTLPSFTSSTSAAFVAGATGGAFTVSTTGIPTAGLSESGALPSGLSFTDNGDGTATISGTPSSSSLGSYSLTLQAANVVGSTSQPFVLTVVTPPTFSSASTVGFVVNQSGTFTIKTSGGVDHLLETGSLPSGLSFTDNGDGTATITGTPVSGTIGTYVLTLTAKSGTATVATQQMGLTVTDSATSSEVDSIYWALLGRTADPSGLKYFDNLVNQGAALSTVVAAITTSNEFRQLEVANLYQILLHRAPDPQGLASFVGFLNNGGSLGQVGAAIASSPEFVNANGGTATSAMAALYQDALGRQIDPQGSNTVSQDLQAGESFFQITLMVFDSNEYHQLQVKADYSAYLGRTPDATGLSYWSSVLDSGVSNEMVLALMLGDPTNGEFIKRTSAIVGL